MGDPNHWTKSWDGPSRISKPIFIISTSTPNRAPDPNATQIYRAWQVGRVILEFTPPKINMEPKNGDLEHDFPLQLGDF